MPTLSKPVLKIQLIGGSNQADVTVTCQVSFSKFDLAMIEHGLRFRARCLLRGADSGFNGADDDLTYLPSAFVGSAGTVTFHAKVNKSVLDEDWGQDEIYARVTLTSLEALVPFSRTADSAIVTGSF